MKRVLSCLVVLVLVFVLVACGKKAEISVADADKNFSLAIGETKTIGVMVSKDFELEFSSNKISVATITAGSEAGTVKITAIAEGNAEITLGIKGEDVSLKINVTVTKPNPTEVSIVGSDKVILNSTIRLTGSVIPNLASQTLVWDSSDKTVATVDQDGNVKGLKVGTTIISATSILNTVKKTLTIQIVLPDPSGIDVTGPATVEVTKTATYVAVVDPSLASQAVNWSVSDDTKATITAEGILTAKAIGTVKVIATSKVKATVKKELTIEIVLPDPTSIVVTGPETVEVTKTATYLAVVDPSLASQEVNWTVSDDSKATINAEGILTAKTAGTVKVIATSKAKDTVKKELTIEIFLPVPTSIVVTGPATVEVGKTATYLAVVDPTLASQAVNWTVSDDSKATISAEGILTAKTAGTVKVIATSKVKDTVIKELTIEIVLPDPTSISVTGPAKVEVGKTATYEATVTPSAANQDVTWSVSDDTKATITAEGVLTAKVIGTVKVIATSKVKGTVIKELEIEIVLDQPTSIDITGPGQLEVGKTATYEATVTPSLANQDVIWSVSDDTKATITADGVLTAKAEGTVIVTATSKVIGTVVKEMEITIVSLSNILLDSNLEAANGTVINIGNVYYVVGLNAFKNAGEAFTKLIDGSTLTVNAGVYNETVAINVNNVTVLGSNAGVNPVTNLLARNPEAEFQSTITLGDVEGITFDGIKLSSKGQLISSKTLKNIVIKNLYGISPSIDPSQGVVFFNLTAATATDVNENIKVLNCSMTDTKISGFRGIRIQNPKDLIIKDSYFNGFMDPIRLEANGSTGVGANGTLTIENNKLEMVAQYPIMIATFTATSIEINNNYIGVDPAAKGTLGIIQLNNYQPKVGVKTIVNIKNNEIPYNTEWHDIRLNSKSATAAQLEVNVNFNTFNEIPWLDVTKSLYCFHIIDHNTTATDFVINGENNIYLYDDEVLPEFFKNADYNPYFISKDEINSLYVDSTWTDKTAGDIIDYNHTTLKFGERAFATLQDALAVANENDKIILLPGTYSDDVTINIPNLTITSLNENVNPNGLGRNEEAIYTGKITLGKNLVGFEISGLKFIGNAQIINTIGDAGTASAPATNLNGFTFKNNLVITGLTSGNGFIYFVEGASSYSHDLVFANNRFSTTEGPTTLLSVIYINNHFNLDIVGNVFEDILCDAFYVFDKTKGMSGETFIQGNTFKNVAGNGFWANWISPLPNTDGIIRIVNNRFDTVGQTAIYLGNLNNSDIYIEISVQYNDFTNINQGVMFNRVHANSNSHINYNIFRTIANTYYIIDGKSAAANVTLDAKNNLYMNDGEVIIPDPSKFLGEPNYTTTYTSEEQVPVYAGEGEIVLTELEINPLEEIQYVGDEYTLTLTYKPIHATNTTVEWTTSDALIATVDADGKVKCLGVGNATITATYKQNPSIVGTIDLNVVNYENIEARYNGNGVIEVNGELPLSTTVFPSSLPGTLAYSSLNTEVATVSSTGVIKGISEGEATIEIQLSDSDLITTITILVRNKVVTLDPIQFIMDANIGNALARNITTFGNSNKVEMSYGAVSKLWFNNVKITESLMAGRPKTKLTSLEFIVVHDTGNNNVGANAEMHSRFLANNTATSWHYTVDDEGAYHHIPLDEVGYHAGDNLREYGLIDTGIAVTSQIPNIAITNDGYYELNGNKTTILAPRYILKDKNEVVIEDRLAKTNEITPSGIYTTIKDGKYFMNNTYFNGTYKLISNHGGGANGIGIESCVDEGSDLYATWQNLAKLVATLLVDNNLGLDRVKQHNNFSGKNCPQTLRTANLWDHFLNLVEFEYKRLTVFKDYTFTFVSNNPLIVDNSGKIINRPKATTEVSYTVTITNPAGYNESITLYTTVPGTKTL